MSMVDVHCSSKKKSIDSYNPSMKNFELVLAKKIDRRETLFDLVLANKSGRRPLKKIDRKLKSIDEKLRTCAGKKKSNHEKTWSILCLETRLVLKIYYRTLCT